MTQETTDTTTSIHQGYEYSQFFDITNDYAGYIDFEGILLPTNAEGGREVKVTISFEVHELATAGYENDHTQPPASAYMTLQEQQYVDGENHELSEARHIPLTVDAAKGILRTWGKAVKTV